MLALGFRKLVWFKTLLASMRNSRLCASTTLNTRDNPKSTVQFAGPSSDDRPAVPSVPKTGIANASRLYHRHVGLLARRSDLHWLPLMLFETRSGRCAFTLPPVPELSPVKVGVCQDPLRARRIPETLQLPRIVFAVVLPRDGVLITVVEFTRCRLSTPAVSQLPRSYFRFVGSFQTPTP